MEKSKLPLQYQKLEIRPKVNIEEDAHVSILKYQTKHFFPRAFYKPISFYIGPRYFKNNE